MIKAIDRDEERNSEVFYHLLSTTSNGNDAGHVFDLNKRTGRITLASSLDREMIDRYEYPMYPERILCNILTPRNVAPDIHLQTLPFPHLPH